MNKTALLAAVIFVLPVFGVLQTRAAAQAPDPAMQWRDATTLLIEGRAFTKIATPYDRLPAEEKPNVSAKIWELSEDSAGLSVRFITDATTIRASWTLRRDKFAMHNMPATGVSGVDLYVRELDVEPAGGNTAWRFLAVGIPKLAIENDVEITTRLKPGKREYRLHLPLYNGVSRVEIGVPADATIDAPPVAKAKLPVVFYGTSVVQGAVASRPGMAYPVQVARALSVDALNMSFSGSCQMEPAMVKIISSIRAQAFVIDCLPNMQVEHIEARTQLLVAAIRKNNPDAPIILAEHIEYADAHQKPERQDIYTKRNAALNRAVTALNATKPDNVSLITAEAMLGAGNAPSESSVDGIHPSDLGMYRIAQAVGARLKVLLK